MAQYTKPALRQRLKAQILASERGGRAGQWSARKAQLLAQEYKRLGGGYIGGLDERARHLRQWTGQRWQTREGSGQADTREGMKRYLPRGAWELLTEQQRRETDQVKQAGRRQFVPNTPAAQAARAYVDHGDATRLDEGQIMRLRKADLLHLAGAYEVSGRGHMRKAQLAHLLHEGFQQANSAMTRKKLLEQAHKYHVNVTQPKDGLIHDIVHAAIEKIGLA